MFTAALLAVCCAALVGGAAAAAAAPASSFLFRSPRRGARRWAGLATMRLQVVTDIDDTIKSSGGVRLSGVPLGGLDTQYARGDAYPGVFQFMFELADHRMPIDSTPLPIAVLTARARELKAVLELREGDPVCAGFRGAARTKGAGGCDWGVGPVLYGSIAEWVFQDRKGWRKYQNFQILLEGSPESTRFIFIGDTGELDEEAAERMLRRFPHRVAAVFMHAVSDDDGTPVSREDRVSNGVAVCYFRTYVGAAMKALSLGLLSPEAALRVAKQAKDDLSGIDRRSTKWMDLINDLNLLDSLLPSTE